MPQFKINKNTLFNIELGNEPLLLDGSPVNADIIRVSESRFHFVHKGKSYNIEIVEKTEKSMELLINGSSHSVDAKTDLDLLLDKMGISSSSLSKSNDLKAPMPGLVLDVKVKENQEVKKGDHILVLEAMKMENIVKAPHDAVIKKILVEKGKNVEKNAVLVTFA